MSLRAIAMEAAQAINGHFPRSWDGQTCILEMRDGGSAHWKQMEWIGFYFQYLCERYLPPIIKSPGPKYGRVEFDGFAEVPWDFKAHAINATTHGVIVNDREAILAGIAEYGSVGAIIAEGMAEYNDSTGRFRDWHSKLKGGPSEYELKRIARKAPSRRRKVAFSLQRVHFLKIDGTTIRGAGRFQENFRNSDGSPRRAKVSLDIRHIGGSVLHTLNL